jgi:hypothetical protein
VNRKAWAVAGGVAGGLLLLFCVAGGVVGLMILVEPPGGTDWPRQVGNGPAAKPAAKHQDGPGPKADGAVIPGDGPAQAGPADDLVAATAGDIWSAFEDTPAEAFKTYSGKLVLLTMAVSDKGQMKNGKFVMFYPFVIDAAGYSPSKGFYLRFSDSSHVPTAKVGTPFVVVGRVVENRPSVVVFETTRLPTAAEAKLAKPWE